MNIRPSRVIQHARLLVGHIYIALRGGQLLVTGQFHDHFVSTAA